MGILHLLVVGTVLAQPASPQGTGGGRPAAARSTSATAFWSAGPGPDADLYEAGVGSVEMEVRDRVFDPAAPSGDTGRVRVTYRGGAATWRVEMDTPGFPDGAALTGGVAGGVQLDVDVAEPGRPVARAAIVVRGLGRVLRDGRVVADGVPVTAVALSAGVHADDGTFRALRAGRPGDLEVSVRVERLPPSADGRGFLEIGFDDVSIDLNGQALPSIAFLDASQTPAAVAGSSTATPFPVVAEGAIRPLPPPRPAGTGGSGAASPTPFPPTPSPLNASPGTSLPSTPTVTQDARSTGLPVGPMPANAQPGAGFPATPSPANAQPGTPAVAPLPLPAGIAPANSQPAIPLPGSGGALPSTPPPGGAR